MDKRERIGVVGGMGPFAGLDLVRKIFNNTIAGSDQEHLPVLLHSFPHEIVDRTAFLLGKTDVNPGDALGEIMIGLGRAGATVLGMPCNTAHSPRILNEALKRLEEAGLNVKFVSIIQASARQLARMCQPGARIGLLGTLGTLRTRLYQDALEAVGLRPVVLDDAGCNQVQDAIMNNDYGIKAQSAPVTARARGLLLGAARTHAESGVSAILLGCTEIPLAITESELFGVPVVDATLALARELVRAAAPEKLKRREQDERRLPLRCVQPVRRTML